MAVYLYSDGSSRGNPGPGGYGTILHYTDNKGELHVLELTEGFRRTTNNRMELLGVIKGLEALNRPCEVVITSDSRYVTDAFNQHWVDGWIKKNYKGVKNPDLWQRLIPLTKKHTVSFNWVKGHAGHPENERCDELATMSADSSDLLIDSWYEENGSV